MIPARFRRLFRNPFREDSLSREVDDEIAFHLAARARDLEATGLGPEAARREARAQFGNTRRWREQSLRERRRGRRQRQRSALREGLILDVRNAVRRLRRRPGFALVTVTVLAAGLGSSTAVIAVLNNTLFLQTPYPDADRVVLVFGTAPPRSGRAFLSSANYFDLKADADVFSAMSTTVSTTATVFTDGPRRISTTSVEAEYFDVIGIEPAQGRRILSGDESPSAEPVAVLTHSFWEAQLGADPSALGSDLRIGSERAVVVGIMPPIYGEEGLLLPYRGDRVARGFRGQHLPMARLRDGVDLETASAQAEEIMRRLADAFPEANTEPRQGGPLTVSLVRVDESIQWGSVRTFFLVISAIVTLFLAVVCLNVSGLLFAHTVSRRRELSVRAALGAGRWRLVREVLTENGVLTALGLLLGVALAYPLFQAIARSAPDTIIGFLTAARIDRRVLAWSVGVAAIMWLASGIVPALKGSRLELATALKDAARTSAPRVHWTRRAIMVSQFTLACALVSGAATVIDGYVRVSSVDPAFDPVGVAALRIGLPRDRYTRPISREGVAPSDGSSRMLEISADSHELTRRVVERLGNVPGVTAVTSATAPPTDPRAPGAYYLPDFLDTDIPGPQKRWHRTSWVLPGYFEAMGIPLLQGRTFDAGDNASADPVVVVNEAFAAWLREEHPDPVGAVIPFHHIGFSPVVEVRVVGVVASAAHSGPVAAAYAPFTQQASLWDPSIAFAPLSRTFLVRTERDADALVPDLERAVWELEPELPFTYVRTLESMAAEKFRSHQFVLVLVGGFAAVALLLAAAGTFALLAQTVRSRTHEMGIRRALGASVRDVVLSVLVDGAQMATLGIVLGLGLSFVLARGLTAWIAGVGDITGALAASEWRALPQIAVVTVLLGSALLASTAPAWVAGRADPVDAMRTE